jgi:ribosomal protein L7/L12
MSKYHKYHVTNRFAKIEKILNVLMPNPNQELFDIILKSEGISRPRTYKIMIDVLGFKLMDCMNLVAILPKVIKEKATKNEVDILKIFFEKNENELEIRPR